MTSKELKKAKREIMKRAAIDVVKAMSITITTIIAIGQLIYWLIEYYK